MVRSFQGSICGPNHSIEFNSEQHLTEKNNMRIFHRCPICESEDIAFQYEGRTGREPAIGIFGYCVNSELSEEII